MSESDDGTDDRNLAQRYADEYGGSDEGLSLLPDDADDDVSGVSVPEPPDAADADPEIANLFWRLVLVSNVSVAALALGPMLIYFRGWWDLGVQVTALGVLAFAYGAFRYYRFRATQDDGERAEQNG